MLASAESVPVAQGTGNNHSVLNTLRGTLGTLNAGGVGTVTIDDGIWNNTENIVVGVHGTGTLNVIDGGSVVTGTLGSVFGFM